jgi:hypothetical protein
MWGSGVETLFKLIDHERHCMEAKDEANATYSNLVISLKEKLRLIRRAASAFVNLGKFYPYVLPSKHPRSGLLLEAPHCRAVSS